MTGSLEPIAIGIAAVAALLVCFFAGICTAQRLLLRRSEHDVERSMQRPKKGRPASQPNDLAMLATLISGNGGPRKKPSSSPPCSDTEDASEDKHAASGMLSSSSSSRRRSQDAGKREPKYAFAGTTNRDVLALLAAAQKSKNKTALDIVYELRSAKNV